LTSKVESSGGGGRKKRQDWLALIAGCVHGEQRRSRNDEQEEWRRIESRMTIGEDREQNADRE
jgi:hypothetical protein